MTQYICPKCQTLFDIESLTDSKCPDCRKWLELATEVNYEDEEPVEEEVELDEYAVRSLELRSIVAASNRTTHAIRSLALFFFTQLRFNLFGGGLMAIGFSLSPFQSYVIFNTDHYAFLGPFLILAGALVSVVGFFIALYRGMRELKFSEV